MYRPPSKKQPFRSDEFGPRVRPRMEVASQSSSSSFFSPNDRVRLITNAYILYNQSSASEMNIFEYNLTVIPSFNCNNIPGRVLKKPAVRQAMRKLLYDVILPRITNGKSTSGSAIIDISLENIFSLHAFGIEQPQKSTSKLNILSFKNLPIQSDLIEELNIDICIEHTKTHVYKSNQSNLKIFSDILHHQLLLRLIKYGSVYYLLNGDSNIDIRNRGLDLISEHILGISVSSTRRNELGQEMVVINSSQCYITLSQRLINLLATFMEGEPTNIEDLRGNGQSEMRALKGDEPWFNSFCTILDGFKCKAQILNDTLNLRFSRANFFNPADAVGLPRSFYQDLNINLMYPNLPSFISPSPKYPYIPFELCTLLPGQKVPIFRLSTAARNYLSTINKQKPYYSRESSREARAQIATICRLELSSFKIKLSEHPIETSGQILPRPKLQFRDRQVQPFRDFWESGLFCQSVELVDNWCVINTVQVDQRIQENFFRGLGSFSTRFGFRIEEPYQLEQPKDTLSDSNALDHLINRCRHITKGRLRFMMFIIDSTSTALNRMIHLSFDAYPNITAACLRKENIMNHRQHKSIFRTLIHKLNARLGGTNVTYNVQALNEINLRPDELMILGFDVTHPDNELKGVSVVGCAYTYSKDLFKHRSIVWPQAARKEFIDRMSQLFERLLKEFSDENKGHLPRHIIIYRDGVSHEDFSKLRNIEISAVNQELERFSRENHKSKPNLSYIVAQKRHTMRFFQVDNNNVSNPPGGTLINEEVISNTGREFYLFSNTSPQATARPIHYHVLEKSLDIDILHKLTYFLCFNFGKCSGSLSMPSSLKYAHNAAYDARNRVINAKEFSEDKFYTNKFFC